MASKWDSLDIDQDFDDLGTQAVGDRPATREDVSWFCDKNFPYLHVVNTADMSEPDEPMSLSQALLPCGWYVYCYHRGDTYLMLMTSRCAGRPDAPLPSSAPPHPAMHAEGMDDAAHAQSDGGSAQEAADDAEDEEGGDAGDVDAEDDEGTEGGHDGALDGEDTDFWDDDEDDEEEATGDWRALSRLAATELIDFCIEHNMSSASIVGGTQYMIESAYLASRGCEEDIQLETELTDEDKKRLDARVEHLTQTYAEEEQEEADATPKHGAKGADTK